MGDFNFYDPNYPNSALPWKGHTGLGCVYVYCGQTNEEEPISSYAGVKLRQPLVANKLYCFSAYIRAYINPTLGVLQSNALGFGVYLSKDPLMNTALDPTAFTVKPQLVNQANTSVQWASFQGCVKAQGGEQYMTLGYFYDGIMALPRTSVPVSPTKTDLQRGGQAVFDDVSLVPIEASQLLGADTSICAGGSLKLRTAFQCAKSFLWSTGSTDSTLTVTQAGTYWLQVTTDCGLLRDTVQVGLRTQPFSLGADTTLCAGQSRTLQGPSAATLIRWDDDSSSPIRTVSQPGTYWVYVEQNGCNQRSQITLRASYPPQLRLPADTTRCQDGPALRLRAGPPTYTYQWADGATDSVRTLTQPGSYSLRASNACGSVLTQFRLRVTDCACQVHWPTAFTPNGDGINDVFTGFLDCPVRPPKALHWQVYNRWGSVIYRSDSLQSGWDGQVGGIAAPLGEYPYRLWLISGPEGQERTHVTEGTVHLLR